MPGSTPLLIRQYEIMKIQIIQYIEGAKKAEGLTIVIDVFRAFTVGCYVINNGAKEIIAVGEVETAYQIQRENPEYILMGERSERIIPGFNFGNSPSHIENTDFHNRTVVQTTSAGTRGLVSAKNASEILTGSFVNADAIVTYIKNRNPSLVSLVAMGYSGKDPADEDLFCAEYIRNGLMSLPTDLETMFRKLRHGSGKRFFKSSNQKHSPPRDFELCTRVGLFNFIIKAESVDEDTVILKRKSIT